VSISPPDPAPYLLWGGVSLLIVFFIWRGWRLGLARQAADLFGLICGCVAGYFGGGYVAPLLWSLGFPKTILELLGQVIVGLTVYLVIVICAAIFLKKTAQQSFGPLRWVFGFGGAAIALATGLLFVGTALVGIRLYGTILQPTAEARPDARTARANALPGWMNGVVKLKQALEEGIPGFLFTKADPVSTETYDIAGKMGSVLANPRAVERFLAFPNVRPLAEHPKIVALRDDPELLREAQSGNYAGLLRNPRLVRAMDDPEIARLLHRLDFAKALDYALAQRPGPR
jgi:hypothetical protein